MFTGVRIGDTGIAFLTAEEPFSIDDVLAFSTTVAQGGKPGLTLDMPAIIDMRRVNLVSVPTAEISRYVMRRRALTAEPMAGHMAIVCGDMGSFGMLRMFGIVSELSGLRAEDMLCVTLDLAEAVAFICDRTGRGREAQDDLLRQVEVLAESRAAEG